MTVQKKPNKHITIIDRRYADLPVGETLTVICGPDLPSRGYPEFLDHTTYQNGIIPRIERFPETGLHPQYHWAIVHGIAHRVNKGEQVVLMTYSDYIIKEINTLIMINDLPVNRQESIMKQYPKYEISELLDPSKIKSYDIDNENIKICNVSKYGIPVPSFDEVIDKMNEVQDEIVWGE